MQAPQEFHYRLPGRARGWRPGAHHASSLGAGQEFVSHARLFDQPDPRRLDLRASLRNLDGDWLVRTHRQRAAVPLHALVDVSASMGFGAPRSKLDCVADFVAALGASAFRSGDAAGLLAFDAALREDLFVPALRSRGIGAAMAAAVRGGLGGAGSIDGLLQAAAELPGRGGLVFVVSDFHWPLARLGEAFDALLPAAVVPIIVWDLAELEPPQHDGLAMLRDAETGALRPLWLRPALRVRWREAVALRRAELVQICSARGLRPFHVEGAFDADALSEHFLAAAA